ncbi:MAG TPA: prolyl oligopeptidase family serine peptidase, partial [Prosthecobacter sp.]|nr:prolyl oligopeptidase family serine peptidase [Prosthecobacter sp.]
PTLLFHGTEDTTTPFKGAQLFHDEMQRVGNRCELVVAMNTGHTYMFKEPVLYQETLKRLDRFLSTVGMIQAHAE